MAGTYGLYTLVHTMRYRYSKAVGLHPHLLRLKPAQHEASHILSYDLSIDPKPHQLYWRRDAHGSEAAYATFSGKIQALTITVRLDLKLAPFNPFAFLLAPEAAKYPFTYEESLREDLASFLTVVPQGENFSRWLETLRGLKGDTVESIALIARKVAGSVKYNQRHEPGVYSPEELLARGEGTCRDLAWLLVQTMRHLSMAARFVSGYLVQPELAMGAAEYHAWAEVFLPGAGWVGMDATSGLLAGEGHIPLAISAIPARTAAVTGSTEPCDSIMEYETQLFAKEEKN